MDGFKEWIKAQETTARKRASMNVGVPAQVGLVFSKTPYSAEMFCKKIHAPGVRVDNMNTTQICGKGKNGTKQLKS